MLLNIFKGRGRDTNEKTRDGRNIFHRLVEHPDVELLVNLVIILNCVALAMEDPMLGDFDGINAYLWWIGESDHAVHSAMQHV